MSDIRRLGIMGGTFDPIHYGHLVAAEEARERFEIDQVVFIPNWRSPIKDEEPVSSPEDRYAMCTVAIESNPAFACSRVEIERPGPSYSIDTVGWFREQHPTLDKLYFITGADAVSDIRSWRRYEELIESCEFIAASRPGTDFDQLRGVLGQQLLNRIRLMQIPAVNISSSDLRRRISEGRSIRYQTPDCVESYIREHGLYLSVAH